MYSEKTPIHLQEIYRYIWTATSFFLVSAEKSAENTESFFFLFKGLLDLHFSIEMPLHRRAKYGY